MAQTMADEPNIMTIVDNFWQNISISFVQKIEGHTRGKYRPMTTKISKKEAKVPNVMQVV